MNYLILGTGRFSEEDYKKATTGGSVRFGMKPKSVQDIQSALASYTPDYLLIDLTNTFDLNFRELANVLEKYSPMLVSCIVIEDERQNQALKEICATGFTDIFSYAPSEIQTPKELLDSFDVMREILMKPKSNLPLILFIFGVIIVVILFKYMDIIR